MRIAKELRKLYYETLTSAAGNPRCEKARYPYEESLRSFRLEMLTATCMALDACGSLPKMQEGYAAIEDKSSQQAKEMEGYIAGAKALGFTVWERSQFAIDAKGAAKEVAAFLPSGSRRVCDGVSHALAAPVCVR